ncbi:hsp70 protein domain-containing protein [Cordyceps javanica]|nr:hsp70 protein domain-containing protein [Cordyceps javanica]
MVACIPCRISKDHKLNYLLQRRPSCPIEYGFRLHQTYTRCPPRCHAVGLQGRALIPLSYRNANDGLGTTRCYSSCREWCEALHHQAAAHRVLDAAAEVILTGGGSLHPAFSKAVRSRLEGRTFLPQRPPSEVVAEGAAIVTEAAQLGIVLTAVLPRSVGIKCRREKKSRKKSTKASKKYQDDLMAIILRRNTPIPCEISQTFTAIDEEETEIEIFEGEFAKASDNIFLDKFGIQAPKNTKIRVTFSVDANCEFRVTARSTDEEIIFPVIREHREPTDRELQTLQEKANRRFNSSKKALPITEVNAVETEHPVTRPSDAVALAMEGGPRRSKRKRTG